MNPKLQDAVAIFKELGWESVTLDNVLSLPLGTKDQKQTALAGLKSGEWGKYGEIGKNSVGWRKYTDVDEGKLALFAIRLGVNARRAVGILNLNTGTEMIATVITERGEKYASDFIGFVSISGRRGSEHGISAFGNLTVWLVDKMNLEIPQNVEYIKDWSVSATAAMGLLRTGVPRWWFWNAEGEAFGLDFAERRFEEHISTGIAVGAPATGPFGLLVSAGVKRGWLSQENGTELAFSALDAAVRPGDRKAWLKVLDELAVSDKELTSRTQALIPLLASGDSALIARIAPVLIKNTGDDLLSEVILSSLSAETKKTRKMVLKSALNRQCPENAEELESWLLMLAQNADREISALSAKLIKQWGINADIPSDEKTDIRGLWRETPELWQVPAFELGDVSAEALTELAAVLMSRSAEEDTHDVTSEQFLAVANAVAYQNPEAARTALRGLRGISPVLSNVIYWIKGKEPPYYLNHDGTEKNWLTSLRVRDFSVCLHLDKLPCLLSTPDKDDLSISVSSLAARLELYKKTETAALEADFVLALARLDLKTKTQASVEMLQKLDVPIMLPAGEQMSVNAGQVVTAYLDDPIIEPEYKIGEYWHYVGIKMPDSLRHFMNRFNRNNGTLYAVFPNWGDVSLAGISWYYGEVYHEKGIVLRQAARRSVPLPPGGSINMLAAQRSSTDLAAEDSLLAVSEAWERGLLRPGIADIGLLDWRSEPPSHLAAFAAALDGIAQEGMLSVVWPVLDELIIESLKAPRLLSGTAEIAELIAVFLPEVQFAVEQGIAEQTALCLPGMLELAKRGGTSRAVAAARKVAEALPAVPVAAEKQESAAAADDHRVIAQRLNQ